MQIPDPPTKPTVETALVGIIALLLLVYLAADLVSQTLALDGLVYANIAMRLAAGEGGFWALPDFVGGGDTFHDHPPLGIYFLALWMQVLGSEPWVEKLFSLVLMLAILCLVARLAWRENRSAILPILLLVCAPMATYTLKNNFLETQICLVNLLACAAVFRAQKQLVWACAVGCCAFVGLLIKGPIGLLPLLLPIALWLTSSNKKSPLQIGVLSLLTFTSLCVVVWWQMDSATLFLERYWQGQVLASIEGTRPAEHGRAYLLGQAAWGGLIMLLVAALFGRPTPAPESNATFWALMALMALLPLLLSARHYRHYLLPMLPFLALFISAYFTPRAWLPRLPRHAYVLLLVVAAALLFQTLRHWQQPGDHAHDIRTAARLVQSKTTLTFCADPQLLQLRLYAFRHHRRPSEIGDKDSVEIICTQPPSPLHTVAQSFPDGVHVYHLQPGIAETPVLN